MEKLGEYWEMITIILSCTGIWKVVEILIKAKFDKRLRIAETKNLTAQAEGQIVGNWIDWSRHLEQQVKELENKVDELNLVLDENIELEKKDKLQKKVLDAQATRIKELEKKIKILQNRNQQLEQQIENLRK